MNKPTKEEMIEYYKDAEEVRCLFSKQSYKVSHGEIVYIAQSYWIDLRVFILKIWDDQFGYAEITKKKK